MITNILKINGDNPVDLKQAKDHLFINHDEDDQYIQDLIEASISHAEGLTNRKLSAYEITEVIPELSGNRHLKYGNNSDIQIRSANTLIDSSKYQVGIDQLLIQSTIKNVTLTYRCGYSSTDCPMDIKAAILLLVATLYESRADVSFGVQQYKSALSSSVILNKYKLY